MTSTGAWILLCYIYALRHYHSDARKAAESDPDAIQMRLSFDFRDWTDDDCRTVASALKEYLDGGEGREFETEIADLRRFLESRLPD
ncbi:MAG: hypothetical protein OXN96_06630 [Bryobacterales bacterium]|nr:hypothetical protein [Bryobacterales bacterium]MDE0624456.1 hypothetical protein [Bryobacterales bacterium]